MTSTFNENPYIYVAPTHGRHTTWNKIIVQYLNILIASVQYIFLYQRKTNLLMQELLESRINKKARYFITVHNSL